MSKISLMQYSYDFRRDRSSVTINLSHLLAGCHWKKVLKALGVRSTTKMRESWHENIVLNGFVA